MKKILEQRTAFGTEYVEFKKEKSNYYNKSVIFYRKSWDRLPRGKWISRCTRWGIQNNPPAPS